MIRYNLIMAARNMLRYWRYTLINIGGLALGMGGFIFIFLYISDELQFDRHHQHADRIYRVNRWYNTQEVNEDAATCSFPCGPAIQTDYPHLVEEVVRFFNFQLPEMMLEYQTPTDTIRYNEARFYLADSTVFNIFSFDFLEGDPRRAFDQPNSIVLTQSSARRYFGEETPMNKILRLEEYVDLKVTGVLEDLPLQSHIQFDILGSLSTYRMLQGKQGPQQLLGALTRYRQTKTNRYPETWVWNPCWTYLMLYPNVDHKELEAQFGAFYQRHYDELKNQNVTLYLQPLTRIHLHSDHDFEMNSNSNISYIYLLAVIAIVILLLASTNFINLTTATSFTRSREIGIKKVYGATSVKLMVQFMGETLILTTISLILAILLVEFTLPVFNHFTGKNISPGFLFSSQVIIGLAGLLILVNLLSGIYPSLCLSRYHPLALFKNQPITRKRSLQPRKILVTSQFIISTTLIITSMMAYSQLKYLRKAQLGFNSDQVIIFRSAGKLTSHYSDFKEELLKHKDITAVTGMEDILGVNHNTRAYQVEGLEKGKYYYIPTFLVEWDFVETFQIRMLSGRSFSKAFPDDQTRGVIINQTMAHDMGWSNEEALGKEIRSQYGEEKVIGVCQDFHVQSLHQPLNKFIIDMYSIPEEFARVIAVRVRGSDMQPPLAHIRKVWHQYNPTRPIKPSRLKTQLDNLYVNEANFGRFATLLTFMALIIAGIGLLGLTSFYADQKKREICLRKVHGAKLNQINQLIFNEFSKLAILSNLIAWPVTLIIAQTWLNSYAKHANINLWIFLLAGLVTFALLSVIVTFNTIKSYNLNPANVLKYQG